MEDTDGIATGGLRRRVVGVDGTGGAAGNAGVKSPARPSQANADGHTRSEEDIVAQSPGKESAEHFDIGSSPEKEKGRTDDASSVPDDASSCPRSPAPSATNSLRERGDSGLGSKKNKTDKRKKRGSR